MDKIIKVYKNNKPCYIDLNNVPTKIQPSGKEVYDFKKCNNTEVPFEYIGVKGYIVIEEYLPSTKDNKKARLKLKYDNNYYVINKESFLNVSLKSIVGDKLGHSKESAKRKMYYESLPLKNNGKVDLKNSIGCDVYFEFNNYKGYVTILDYFTKYNNKGKEIGYIRLEHDNKNRLYNEYNFFTCNISYLANKNSDANKNLIGEVNNNYEIVDYFNEEFINKDGTINTRNMFKVKCLTCGTVKKVRVDHFLNGVQKNCGYCAELKSKNKENKNKFNIKRSYPEKVVKAYLDELDISYIQEKTFDFLKRRRYDFYLPNLNCVIEVHGAQHYKELREGARFKLTLKEQQRVDKEKKDAVLNNGIKYVEINAEISDFEYIKNSIKNSSLYNTDVNWFNVFKNSFYDTDNILLVKKLYEKNLTLKEISIESKLNKKVVREYINKLKKLNQIEYEAYEFEIRDYQKEIDILQSKIDNLKSKR